MEDASEAERETRGEAPRLLTVVVMAYNEAATLAAVVSELLDALAALRVPFEVLVVDDGSNDGTSEMALALAGTTPGLRLVRHPENRGLGGVYRTGFAEARGTYLTFLPADGQFPPSYLGPFLARMAHVDLVLGYIPDRRDGPVGRFLSWIERRLYGLLVGPLPRFQGVLLLRRSLLAELRPSTRGRGWVVLMELILRAARSGVRIESAPTEMRPRASGRSKVANLRTMWANLRELVALRRVLDETRAPANGPIAGGN